MSVRNMYFFHSKSTTDGQPMQYIPAKWKACETKKRTIHPTDSATVQPRRSTC